VWCELSAREKRLGVTVEMTECVQERNDNRGAQGTRVAWTRVKRERNERVKGGMNRC
jgi:hypothetical protein